MIKMALIFDFDGTLNDSWPNVHSLLYSISQDLKINFPNENLIERYRNIPTSQILRELNIPWRKLPMLVNKYRNEYATMSLSAPLRKQLLTTIIKYKDSSVILGILTSNKKEIVKQVLDRDGVIFFDFISDEKNPFSKAPALKKIIRQYNLQRNTTFYIGDEIRDIIAARKSGVKSIAVTWGINKEEILKQQKPDYLVRNTNEFNKLLSNLLQ